MAVRDALNLSINNAVLASMLLNETTDTGATLSIWLEILEI